MLTGIWHGAYWNYFVWGLYFGLWLLFEKAFLFCKDKSEKTGVFGFVWRVVAVTAVIIGWGIFYYEDFDKMRQFFSILCGNGAAGKDLMLASLLSQNVLLLVVSAFCCIVPQKFLLKEVPAIGRFAMSAAFLIISTILLIGATNHPFLYTRF